MSQRIGNLILRQPPLLRVDDTVEHAVQQLRSSGLPGLPVVDGSGRLKGIFGEREFFGALFPGYLKDLKFSGFLSHDLDAAFEKREACRMETLEKHINTEHIHVSGDVSDLQLAETFLHHRVIVIPVVDDGEVQGLISRHEFFAEAADRFLGLPGDEPAALGVRRWRPRGAAPATPPSRAPGQRRPSGRPLGRP